LVIIGSLENYASGRIGSRTLRNHVDDLELGQLVSPDAKVDLLAEDPIADHAIDGAL
jgi:hypothetical protein